MSNKIQRNFKCPCGSGKKFKQCCEPEVFRVRQQQRIQELHPVLIDDNITTESSARQGIQGITY